MPRPLRLLSLPLRLMCLASFRAALRPLPLFAAFVVLTVAARAQSVHWENGDSGDPSDVQLVFTDCAPDGDPQLPALDGMSLAPAGRSENTSIVNFTMTRSVVLAYRARATKPGALRIPAFTVKTTKGDIAVPAFTGGTPRTAADANIFSHLTPGAKTVWVGEVFPLTYTLDVARRSFNQLGTAIEWNSAPLVVEEWSKFEPSEINSGGEARLNIIARTRGYAKSPGPLSLTPANQLVNIQTGSVGFGLFSTPRIEQLAVTSDRPTLNVRPLPPAPASFHGAVGRFKLTSKVVPATAAVGEPITWTLELAGAGNWPEIAGLPQREVSKDFSVVQPQAKRTPTDGKLFDVTLTEDVVLVPTRAGTYTLNPVTFTFFNPATGDYENATTPRTTVTITPAAAPSVGVAPTPQATPSSIPATVAPAESKIENREAKIPAAPLGLPRDPLAGTAVSSLPLAARTLLVGVVLPFALLPLLWLALALRRAQQTDPLRPQRDARARLATTLPQLSTLNSQLEQQRNLLLAWQHDTALLFRLPHAAPPAAALGDATWAQLWQEADRAIYGAHAPLPADWHARALAALETKRLPGFQPFSAFRLRNLFPVATALVVVCALAPLATHVSAAPSPEAAYRAGDFAAAEKTWTETVAQSPTDAIARYNLSLALAQQDRWAEAAAHAAAAFVQEPDRESFRWQLALASNKAGYAPASLAHFLPPGPLESLAGHASPVTWQRLALAAAILAALALGTLLFSAYAAPRRWRVITALVLLGLALLTGLAAVGSLHAFGDTADQRAVIVWRAGTLRSIPTEADTTQKTTPLAAGSLAIKDKTLLGWVRLRFDHGQTGWVRREEVIGLWR